MSENKISIICRTIVRYIGIVFVGYLFLQGLFTICCIQQFEERTFFIQNNVFKQLCGIGFFILVMRLMWNKKLKKFINKYGNHVVILMLLLIVGFLGIWVYNTQFWYVSDMEAIFANAEQLLVGNYTGWQPGGYPHRNPHQNGLLLLVAFLRSFLTLKQSFNAFYVINIVMYMVTIISLLFSLKLIYKDKEIYCVQILLMICFLPYSFFCLMMYGNVMSFGWACISMVLGLAYCKEPHWLKLVGSALCMIMAIVLKQNQLIVFVAIMIMFVFSWINAATDKGSFLMQIAIYAIVVIIGTKAPDFIISNITGFKLDEGNSPWSYVAMGLMSDENTTPGWYNWYNVNVFIENDYDHDATEEVAKDAVVTSIQNYVENPAEGWKYINHKLASEWNNPTFECFGIQNARGTGLELSNIVKSTLNDGGKINIVLIYFFDIFQSIFLFGVLIYLVMEKDVGWDKLLYLVLFIGGFLFYTMWEAKAQYVVYYFLLLIPYSVPGYLQIIQKGTLKKQKGLKFEGWNKLHTALIVLAVLIIFIASSDAQWVMSSFKIHTDTEAYYNYIHQYNSNFVNLRF